MFFESLEGMTDVPMPSMDIFRPYVPDVAGFIEKGDRPGQSCMCTGKIRHKGKSTLVDAYNYLKTLVPENQWGEIKVTMISPSWYHLRYKTGQAFPTDVYPNDEAYFEDIAKAFQTELDILYDAGVRNIQIDDPLFACKYTPPTEARQGHLPAPISATCSICQQALTNSRLLLRENGRRMEARLIQQPLSR